MRIFLICLVIISYPAIMFSQTISGDSLSVADSVSYPYLQPIPYIGALSRTNIFSNSIIDSTINFSNYRYVGDLLETQASFFNRDFGSLGLLPDINIYGLDGRNIAFFADGIRLNEPFSGIFNPFLFPAESIEEIEIITGTRAFVYGLNSTGAAINFLSKSKKAVKPYSRLRYSESGYGFSIIDGLVSQDVIRGLNITAGAQHTVYGQRYLNENYDGWNARIKARYNLNENLNFFASEMYNQTLLGLWQGVDILKTPDSLRYEVLQATIRNTDAYEKITRHDIQLGTAAHLLPDSNAISMLTLYYTSNVRHYRDLENKFITNGIFSDQKFVSNWYGARLTQNLIIDNSNLDFGAEIRSYQILITPSAKKQTATYSNLYVIGETNIFNRINISPYARLDLADSKTLLGYGADAKINIIPSLSFFAGYSRSYRLPVFQEISGIDTIISSNLNNDPERHHLLELGLCWNPDEKIKLEIKSFNRIIWNSITISPTAESSPSPFIYTRTQKTIMRGLSAKANARLWFLLLEFNGEYLDVSENSVQNKSIPHWNLTGGLYFWNTILNDHLDLKFGLKGRYFSVYYSSEFNQETGSYLPSVVSYAIQPTAVMDLVVLAHIGQAYIHLIWDNILNRQYIMQNFYPMPERQMRFGVSWEFLE